jgi:3-isopropylmalate/(R)-2-methylmalate dehydratase small subunit
MGLDWTRPWTAAVEPLAADDVDTDQIIPARFLTATTREGMGRHLFADWPPAAGIRAAPVRTPRVLLAGRNFGCGSSREHAPWALVDAGFRAVVARSFADIFRANALKNGLLPVALAGDAWEALAARGPGARLTIDLASGSVGWDGGAAAFVVDPFARLCLLEGTDELGYLLARLPLVEAFEAAGAGD